MKNKSTKIISLLSVFVMMFSALASGCSKPDDGTSPSDSVTSLVVDNSENHYQKITETNEYLVKNGRTEYYIVYPEDLDRATSDGVSELKYFFEKATGIKLRATSDTGMTHDDNKKVFSIGRTTLFQTSGLTIDEERLGNDGHIVKTVGNTIYLVGGSYAGNLFAVYTFLERAFNYDTYFRDSFTIDEVDTYKLYNYDIIEIPDVLNRRPGTDYASGRQTNYDDIMHYNRLRVYTAKQGQMPIHNDYGPLSGAGITHNAPCFLPDYMYKDEHPKWYNTALHEDLCYTAHGDEEELTLMIAEVVKKIQYSLMLYTPKNYPFYNTVVIQKLDQGGECGCDGCMATKIKYGTQSAAVIKFVNRVSTQIDEWMEKPENAEYKRLNFKVMFLGYHQYGDAPVSYNEKTGEYEPIDDSVIFVKNAGVQHAPVYGFDSQSPLYAEVNETGLESIKRWQVLCQEGGYGLWSYGSRFGRSLYYYDTLNHFNNDYFRTLYANGRCGLFFCERLGAGDGIAPGFENLKDYIQAKLSWNCNVDMDSLIEKYINGVFGDAAPYVRQYFDELRVHLRKVTEAANQVVVNSMYYNVENAKMWPYAVYTKWLGLFDQAFAAIEPLKTTDPTLYNRINKNLCSEYVSPAYIMLNFYKTEMAIEERDKTIDMIANSIRTAGIKVFDGSNYTDEYIRKLYEE